MLATTVQHEPRELTNFSNMRKNNCYQNNQQEYGIPRLVESTMVYLLEYVGNNNETPARKSTAHTNSKKRIMTPRRNMLQILLLDTNPAPRYLPKTTKQKQQNQ